MMALMSRLSSMKTLMRFNSVCKWPRWCSSSIQKEIDSHFTRSKINNPVDDTNSNKVLFISSPSDHGRRRNSFLFSYLLEGQIVKRWKLDLDSPGDVKVLKPVNGLVCFCRYDNNSVLIFNPSTGERTSWIESPTYNEELVEGRIKRASSYGFGYDPTTNEHKVACIQQIFQRIEHKLDFTTNVWADSDGVTDFTAFDLGEYEDVEVCRFFEVLTVGENRWRRIEEEVPPFQLSSYNVDEDSWRRAEEDYISPDRYNGVTIGHSIYANGSIYWRAEFHKEAQVLVAFDVVKEKFRVIPIPDFVIDPLDPIFLHMAQLMELDGRIALVKWKSSGFVTLWKFDDDNKENRTTSNDYSEWTKEEKFEMPTLWDWKEEPIFLIEAIAGTDTIILYEKFKLHYLTRKWNIFVEFDIAYDDIQGLRWITNFVESLLPVQKHKHSSATSPQLGN